MARIIVIGAGIGGMSAAYELRELASPGDQLMVVSDTPTFHFVRPNPWVQDQAGRHQAGLRESRARPARDQEVEGTSMGRDSGVVWAERPTGWIDIRSAHAIR